ncbi:MAG: aspartyl protease family protein [Cyclobacteriaceae bacterium]
MRKYRLFCLILLISVGFHLNGQTEIGFKMPEDKNKVEIPIELINNLVVIPVTVNRFLPLKFILDTGVETAILTEPDFAPLMQVDYVRKFIIYGAGVQDSISAYLSQGLVYELPGGIIGRNMNLLILDDDYLKLSERMGQKIHGIIGFDLFKQFTVRINYDERMMTIYRNGTFNPTRRMSRYNLEIVNSRPYIQLDLSQTDEATSAKLMIDTGASHALLLDATQTDVSPPKKTINTYLGAGLGGEIPGRIGRLGGVTLNELSFKDVLIAIPDDGAYSQTLKRGSRQGTLGGELLSRLNPVFDYQTNSLYLSKGNDYSRAFELDMSGMGFIVQGTFLDTLRVDYIRENSPAKEVDIRVNDVILSINGRTLGTTNLNTFYSILRRRPNQKIRIRILRNGKKIRKKFRLKRAI